jgi:hypothetical protein
VNTVHKLKVNNHQCCTYAWMGNVCLAHANVQACKSDAAIANGLLHSK